MSRMICFLWMGLHAVHKEFWHEGKDIKKTWGWDGVGRGIKEFAVG